MPVDVPTGYMSSLAESMLFKNKPKRRGKTDRHNMLQAKSFLLAWWHGPIFIRLPMGLARVDVLKRFRHKCGRRPCRPNPSRVVFNPIKEGLSQRKRGGDKHSYPSCRAEWRHLDRLGGEKRAERDTECQQYTAKENKKTPWWKLTKTNQKHWMFGQCPVWELELRWEEN